MKTICFFNSAVPWGGGEKWHLETSKYLNSKGFDVLFLCNKNSELHKRLQETDLKYMVLEIGNLSFLNPISVFRVKQILVKHHVDTIVINLSRDLKIAGIAAKLANVRRIIYRRGSAIPIKNSFLNRFYFSNIVTDVLANSLATKRTVLQNNADLFPEDKIKVIYNGIDIKRFSGEIITPYYLRKKNEIVLVTLGRLEFEKNHEFLIEVAAELKSRNIQFKLIIAGDGSLRRELEDLTQKLNVAEDVLFPGFISNPKELLSAGDVFLLSSLWEGFGYVLAEAELSKLPIIAFNLASIPEIVINNESGFLVPLNDIKQFADKIEFIYNHPEIGKDMGLKGYDFALKTFDNHKIQLDLETYLIEH